MRADAAQPSRIHGNANGQTHGGISMRQDSRQSPSRITLLFHHAVGIVVVGILLCSSRTAARGQSAAAPSESAVSEITLDWQSLPALPNELGVAGPFVGMHNDALIVAGGANFPQPVWENDKVWHDEIYVLIKTSDGYQWRDGGKLPRPIAYGAAVSTDQGVVCIGGNNGAQAFDDVFLLRWDPASQQVTRHDYPRLPRPCAYGQATVSGDVVYLAGGQSGDSLDSAMNNFWSLDISQRYQDVFAWKELEAAPGPPRAFNITAAQHNGYDDCVYVISGRRQDGQDVAFLRDIWEFNTRSREWRRRADAPACVMAGLGIGYGQSHIFILGGADGSLFTKADVLKDNHPGFPKKA